MKTVVLFMFLLYLVDLCFYPSYRVVKGDDELETLLEGLTRRNMEKAEARPMFAVPQSGRPMRQMLIVPPPDWLSGRPKKRLLGRPKKITEGRQTKLLEGRPKKRLSGRPKKLMEGRSKTRLLGRPKKLTAGRPKKLTEGLLPVALRHAFAQRNAHDPALCRKYGEECGGFHWPCCVESEFAPLCCHFPRNSTDGVCITDAPGVICDRLWQ